MSKTNAARHLDSLGIAYELRDYAVDPEEFSAILVAEKIGLPPEPTDSRCSSPRADEAPALLLGALRRPDLQKSARPPDERTDQNGENERTDRSC